MSSFQDTTTEYPRPCTGIILTIFIMLTAVLDREGNHVLRDRLPVAKLMPCQYMCISMHGDVLPGCIPSEDLVIAMTAGSLSSQCCCFADPERGETSLFRPENATLRKWLAVIGTEARVSSNEAIIYKESNSPSHLPLHPVIKTSSSTGQTSLKPDGKVPSHQSSTGITSQHAFLIRYHLLVCC